MSCLGCGIPGGGPRGWVGLCPGCLTPRIGRAATPAEALYQLLQVDEQALDRRAEAAFGRAMGEAVPPAEVNRQWLALHPARRRKLRGEALEQARLAAGVPKVPRRCPPLVRLK